MVSLARFFPLPRFIRLVLASSAFALFVPALRAQAIITWGPATTIVGDTDVATNGTPLYAYNLGSASTAAVVNGITFQIDPTGVSSNYTFSSTPTSQVYDQFGGPSAAFTNLSLDYQTLLNSARYVQSGDGSLTLNNLTIGQTYQVQLWTQDSRDATDPTVTSAILNRNLIASDGPGHEATLSFNSGASTGSLGQYVTGTFTATGTTETISLLRGSGGDGAVAQLNAFSVSTISAIPEPSTYAMLAGIGALGLAVWRRRITVKSAASSIR